MKEIEDISERGARVQAETLQRAFRARSSLGSADTEQLRHEREVLIAQQDAQTLQLERAAAFRLQVRAQAMEHQERMVAEARNLRQHAADEKTAILQSCQRKADETISFLKSQIEREQARVEEMRSQLEEMQSQIEAISLERILPICSMPTTQFEPSLWI
eukprot:3640144-Amphidinium_carterae.2